MSQSNNTMDLSPTHEKQQTKLEDDAWIGRLIDSKNITVRLNDVKDRLEKKRRRYGNVYTECYDAKEKIRKLENFELKEKLKDAQASLDTLSFVVDDEFNDSAISIESTTGQEK